MGAGRITALEEEPQLRSSQANEEGRIERHPASQSGGKKLEEEVMSYLSSSSDRVEVFLNGARPTHN
jgi:hypothetical protein